MRVLLTGASGFLGQAFLATAPREIAIVALGRSPVATDRADIEHLAADFNAPTTVQELLEGGRIERQIDVVMHLAVSRRHREFPEAALDMFNVNVAITAHLLDFARKAGVRQFILGSTGTVYHPFAKPVQHEDDALAPGSYFGLTKFTAERLALTYSPAHFSVFVPRFFTPYGPGQEDRLISGLIANIRAGRAVQLPLQGDGLSTSPLYLDDAVRVLLAAIAEGWEGVVNVGGPEVLSLTEISNCIGKVVGRDARFDRAAGPLDAALVPDLTRLAARMPVDGFVRFAEGLARFVSP